MKEKLKDALITTGWGATTASIILRSLYIGASLTWLDYVFIFALATLAGLILVDLEKIVYGLIPSLLVTILIMVFCLTLPATLGKVSRYAPLEAFYSGVIVMIFKSIFPVTIIMAFLGSFLGGMIGEKLRLR